MYARDHEAVWFKGKRFAPSIWAGTSGEQQIKQLKAALDSKGKKVSEEWFTTTKVEDALMRFAFDFFFSFGSNNNSILINM